MCGTASPPRPPRVVSPCIGICTIDSRGSYCIGCKRTLDEIGRWSIMDDVERRRIIDELPTRTRQR
ncbi:MAG: DUF1289 domain-containing protein [Proteobacteria bacterium]|nr:DUF1289 domain-containing protein [Pseudomonadota bacterium]